MTKAELIEALKEFPDDMEISFSCSECVFKEWHPNIKIDTYPSFLSLSEPEQYISFHLEGSYD